jgi:hypothetical protein
MKALENICPPPIEVNRERKKSNVVMSSKPERDEARSGMKEEYKEELDRVEE